MLVFFFTDIEGSSRLWEEHTEAMTPVIARHDQILRQQVEAAGGRITKHTGDGITAVFEAGQPLACALEAQVCFAAEPWGEIGELRIRAGLHAGEAEFHLSAGTADGDYFGPPVNATARVMSAAWGGQVLLTPEVTQVSSLPPDATLLDLGQHLLKNVSAPQQLYQLVHPQLTQQEFPPPRTLSGRSIRQAVEQQGVLMANLDPPEMAIVLVSATLLPALLGDLSPGSPALAGNVGVLRDLGARALAEFLAGFAAHLRVGEPEEIRQQLERELQHRWAVDTVLRADASRLLRAVDGVEATMMAATGDIKDALVRGLASLGGQFDEFRWMLGDVQETLAEVRALQREQLDLQQRQLARTEALLQRRQDLGRPALELEVPPAHPAFLQAEAEEIEGPVFVARQRELAWLEGFLETALAGQGRVVFVTGGPGRGKTALLAEFARRAMDAHADLLVANGNCNAYSGVGDPYLPFREVLGQLTGDAESRWAAGRISRDHALRLWGALPLAIQALVDHGPNVIPALVPGPALLSRARAVAPTEAPWLQRLRAQVERQVAPSEDLEQSYLFQQVTHVLRALTEAHPLLLILDDLQWVDAASAGLLFHLGRRLEGSHILIAGAYRPEEVAFGREGERHPLEVVLAELKLSFGHVWLDLAKVEEPEGRRFVDALLETEPNRLGEGFRGALYRHTSGHPLFTVELLRTLQERGDLVQDESGCWMEGPALRWDTLPARVEGVIEARIGRLEEELREILSVASVEGEEFTAQVVARVQEVGERQTLRRLARELEKRHRLVREEPALRVDGRRLSRYRFAHALFQQYLYGDLSNGERALLHGEVAAVLEELYQGRLEEAAVRLARHFTEAGDRDSALKYLILAADRAMEAYANGEAESYCRRALDLAPTESERAHLLWVLGRMLFRQGRWQEATWTWAEGIEAYQALEDSDGVARLYAYSAETALYANDLVEALRLCQEGLATLEGAPASPGLCQLLGCAANCHWASALGDQVQPLVERALHMAEQLGDVAQQLHSQVTYDDLGLLPVERRLEILKGALDKAERLGQLGVAARIHARLAHLTGDRQGDYRAAREHMQRAAELYGRFGMAPAQIETLDGLVTLAMEFGDFDEARRTLSELRGLLRDLPEPGSAQVAVQRQEDWYLIFRGQWAEAAAHVRTRLATARERGDLWAMAEEGSALPLAITESSRFGEGGAGSLEEAGAAMVGAIEWADQSLLPVTSTWFRIILAQVRLLQDQFAAARRLLAEAQEWATQERPGPAIEAALHWLTGQLAAAEGHWPEALAAHGAAAELLARRGLRWYWARFRLDWAETHAARGEPGDREQAVELLRESQTAFEDIGIPHYATVAQQRLDELEVE